MKSFFLFSFSGFFFFVWNVVPFQLHFRFFSPQFKLIGFPFSFFDLAVFVFWMVLSPAVGNHDPLVVSPLTPPPQVLSTRV